MGLKSLSNAGHLKAGFLGFAKSGKTHTAIELALGTRDYLKLDGPIGMFDTERGSEYWAPRVRKRTGKDLLGLKSRSLQDLINFVKDCEREGVSVAVVDSVTHVWREVCDSALREINAHRLAKRWSPVTKLEFQHWGPIKEKWAEWSDLYLNSALHIVICGRAGYEYDFERDESGKKELVKTGVKMKTEAEFGFEPSLLVEMEREQTVVEGVDRLVNRATVLGDRFDVINGRKGDFPGFDFFKPHVELLVPGTYEPVNTDNRTTLGLDETGADEWRREKEQRTILGEEVKSLLVEKYGAGGAKEKAQLLRDCFGTGSWTQVSEKTHSNELRSGLVRLRELMGYPPAGGAPKAQEMPGWAAGGAVSPAEAEAIAASERTVGEEG